MCPSLQRLAFLALPLLLTLSCQCQASETCSDQIHYLSDTDHAYRYLEARQRAIYEANPDIADPYSRAAINKPGVTTTLNELSDTLAHQGCDKNGKNCVGDPVLYKKLFEQLRCTSLPTRFESPLFTVLINVYSGAIEPVIRKDYPKSTLVHLGSLPTGTIDAQAMKPPGISSPIVILNRDLFFFTGAFSKSVSDAVPIQTVNSEVSISHDPRAIAERLRQRSNIGANFADAMSRMVQKGNTQGAQEVLLDADHNRLHARLVSAMDMFIMLHEEAHVLLGHVATGSISYNFNGSKTAVPRAKCDASAPSSTITLLKRSRADELAADALGFKLLLKAKSGGDTKANLVDLMVAAAAADVVFGIIDAADKYNRAANGRSFSDAAHPSAADRRKSLDDVYQALAAPGGPLNGVPDFRAVFDASLDTLLAQSDLAIRKALGLAAAPSARMHPSSRELSRVAWASLAKAPVAD
jgi:hypothetical protein